MYRFIKNKNRGPVIKTKTQILLSLLLIFTNSVYSQRIDSAYIESLFNNGWIQLYSNPDSASWYFEKGKIESEKQGYFRGTVRYYNYDAALHIARGQNEKALEQYDQAIDIAKKNKLDVDLGLTYMKKGILNQFIGEYALAAESFLNSSAILIANEDKKQVIGLYSNIISTLDNLQQQNQSLRNVLPALQNDNTSEKEIAEILSQKKTSKIPLDFPDQTTLRDITGGRMYVIFGGAKFPIESFIILGNYSNYRSIRKIPDGLLSRIPDIPRDGTILRETNDKVGKVYLIKDKMRHQVESPEVLDFLGGWDVLYMVPEHTLGQVPDAGDIVTMENVKTKFNFKKEYEMLIDTLALALHMNTQLLGEVGKKLKEKNNLLQKRKLWRRTSVIGIIALFAIGFLLLRNLRQKQKLHQQSILTIKTEEEMQRKMVLEKERTRIATDMHDDLGAGLTRIKFIAENISEKLKDPELRPEMEKLKSSSIELVENMAEIIWAMNEKNNTLEDLLFYLRSYSVDYCNENNLVCEFSLPENIPQKIIGGQVRRNIFLVLKESLHNIVKHAVAQKVTIHVRADQVFVLTISDDGKGFDQVMHQTGNGLLNMEQRAKALKGKFWTSTSPGTVNSLEIPL